MNSGSILRENWARQEVVFLVWEEGLSWRFQWSDMQECFSFVSRKDTTSSVDYKLSLAQRGTGTWALQESFVCKDNPKLPKPSKWMETNVTADPQAKNELNLSAATWAKVLWVSEQKLPGSACFKNNFGSLSQTQILYQQELTLSWFWFSELWKSKLTSLSASYTQGSLADSTCDPWQVPKLGASSLRRPNTS